MRKAALAAAGFLLALTALAVADQFVPWPSFRHDSQNTGRADYIGADVTSIKWSYETLGAISSSPALGSGGRIYVGSRDGKLYCIDKSGALVWAYDTHGTIDFSSPALAPDGTIYITAFEYGDQSLAEQGLIAINPNGTRKWLSAVAVAPLHSPMVTPGGDIVFGSNGGGLICVGADGVRRWVYDDYTAYSAAPAVAPDGTIYAGDRSGRMHAVNPDGSRRWACNLGGMVDRGGPAVAADGTVYQGCSDGNLYAFAAGGALQWCCAVGGAISSTPALGDGVVYVTASDGRLHAVRADGVLLWGAPCRSPKSSPVVDYAGKIYVGPQSFSADGSLLADCAAAGATDSSAAVGWEGTVFVGAGNLLLALTTGPVPQPQFNLPPVCSITASPLAGSAPLAVSFRAEAGDADGQVVRSVWDFGDGSGAEGLLAVHTYGSVGTYRVELTVYDNLGASAVAEATITVLAPNLAPVVLSSTSDESEGPASLLVNFAAVGSDPEGGPLTYQWTFGDGAAAQGQQASHTYTKVGNYTARVTVTDDGGLTASAELAIKVTDPAKDVPGKHKGLLKRWLDWLAWLLRWMGQHC